jgi:hypothetical protein
MLCAMKQNCVILGDAYVPYHWILVFDAVTETIAARAVANQSDRSEQRIWSRVIEARGVASQNSPNFRAGAMTARS